MSSTLAGGFDAPAAELWRLMAPGIQQRKRQSQRVRLVLVLRSLLLLSVVGAATAAAQSPSRRQAFCVAPPPGSDAGEVLWQREPERVGVGDVSPSPGEVGRRIAGTWDFIAVTTEGDPSPRMARWTLRLIATDSAVRRRCPIGQCRGDYSFPAAGQLLRPGMRFDSVAAAQHRRHNETDVGVSYAQQANRLAILPGPPMMDAGDIFSVSQFVDTAFVGRWESGGFFYIPVPRGRVTMLEKPSGYFCARRIGPSAARR
jgi:hypothetical protein